MKNIATKMLSVSLIALIVLSVITISPALSGGTPRYYPGAGGVGQATMYVSPQDSLYTSTTPTDSRIGTYFTVEVRIANATNIASWQVELSYNKNYLSTVTANCTYASDMIFPAGTYPAIPAFIDSENATHNYVLMTATTYGTVEHDSGTWPASKGLIKVVFKIIADPPAGIGNKLWSSLYIEHSTTGAFGSYTSDAALNDNPLTIIDGYYENAYVPPAVPKYDLTIQVKDTVTTNPIAGALVDVTGPESRSASTNSTGYAVFLDLSTGDYTVTTSATGYQSDSTTVTLDQDKQIQIELTPIPPPPTTGTLNGTVTDASTTLPVQGATVTANSQSTTTDSSGHYQITLDAGTYSVTAEKTGYLSHTVTGIVIIAEEMTTVDIALTPVPPPPTTGTLNGTVTDASTTLPVDGATVTANGESTTTDSSGHYQITLDAGTYSVTAEKTGYVAKTMTDVVIIAETTTTLDIALTPIPPPPTTGTLNGTVMDASSTLPIQGATVTANGISTTTDNSGRYQITLDAGTYGVTAEKTGYLPKTVTGIVIIAEQTTTVDIALTPSPPLGGILNGTVTDASTTLPIQGAAVTANGFSSTTDAEGRYQIMIAPGTYTVTADKSGYASASKTATVTAGMTTTVDFSLEPIVPDFSISASPDSLTIVQGNSGTSTITVTSMNGFNSAISLSVSGAPAGVTTSFSVNPITPPSDGSISSTLTIIVDALATPGTYTLTITGTSGTLSHSVDVSLTVIAAAVPDFSISASPSSLTITQDSSGTSTITVTSLDGFNSVVGLSVSGAPIGVTATLSPTSITPPSDGSATSTLTVLVDSTAAAGNYILTVTGTSGSSMHNTTISLVVKAVQAIKAYVEFKPEALNLKSKGQWITCFIRLPEGYNVSDIDVSTIMLNGTISAEKAEAIRDCNGIVVGLMVKFDRAKVIQLILDSIHPTSKETTAKLTVTGSLKDGTQFQGSDKIKTI